MGSRFILALDPSGNYNEGKGTTGWCLFDTQTMKIAKYGIINANLFESKFAYWEAHIALIDDLSAYSLEIVMEDYLLYANRADSQIGSRLETPKLIGMLEYESYLRSIKVHFQTAAIVKKRWSDIILERKGYLTKQGNTNYLGTTKASGHTLDAVRHALHYATFRKDS